MRQIGFLIAALSLSAILQAQDVDNPNLVYYQTAPLTGAAFAISTQLDGINNNGVAVGESIGAGPTHTQTIGYLFDGKSGSTFSLPYGDLFARVNGINDDGMIVGFDYSRSASNNSVGFVGKPGALSILNIPGSIATTPYDINDAGVIVGGYVDSSNVRHGFIYNPDGTFETIDAPGRTGISLLAINNRGQIVGSSGGGGAKYFGSQDGFLYSNGALTNLFPGGVPVGINDFGEIALANSFLNNDILLPDGTLNTIALPAPAGFVNDLNNERQVVGDSFYATPVPEPQSSAMVTFTAAVFLLRVRRLRNKSA